MNASEPAQVTPADSRVFADLGIAPAEVPYHLARAEQLLEEHEAAGLVYLELEDVPALRSE